MPENIAMLLKAISSSFSSRIVLCLLDSSLLLASVSIQIGLYVRVLSVDSVLDQSIQTLSWERKYMSWLHLYASDNIVSLVASMQGPISAANPREVVDTSQLSSQIWGPVAQNIPRW